MAPKAGIDAGLARQLSESRSIAGMRDMQPIAIEMSPLQARDNAPDACRRIPSSPLP